MATVKLSTTLIIIIAVSGLVGCLLFLFLFFRCCRRPKSAPLPPIQPLAHHREKESGYLSHPPTFRNSWAPNQVGIHESDTSLLKPSGKPSFQTDGSDATPSSSNHSFLNASPQTNLTASPRTAEDEQASQQYISTNRQARSVSRGTRRPRSRVVSVASTNTIFTQPSPRPASIIRGAPHSVLSSVQIVLPTPLAPQLQNHMVAMPSSISQRPNSEFDLSVQDAFRERASFGSGNRQRRSLDTMDQARRSESQAPLRERAVSDNFVPPRLPSEEDITPPLPSPYEQIQSVQATPQDPREGQAG